MLREPVENDGEPLRVRRVGTNESGRPDARLPIERIDHERGRVRVLVSFFGREAPVELDFLQVTRLVD